MLSGSPQIVNVAEDLNLLTLTKRLDFDPGGFFSSNRRKSYIFIVFSLLLPVRTGLILDSKLYSGNQFLSSLGGG
jgi:hypothetical protein